jgi:hypothetical protein
VVCTIKERLETTEILDNMKFVSEINFDLDAGNHQDGKSNVDSDDDFDEEEFGEIVF